MTLNYLYIDGHEPSMDPAELRHMETRHSFLMQV